MLGKKSFGLKFFYNFSLDNSVPKDDFYRKLEAAVDLSWVRPRVAHLFSSIGRPSVDPEVFIKIELIGYLEGITSERELMRQIQDRLSFRRYLGYDLDETVPDHSTLSVTRKHLGKKLFQEVFDYSVRLCQSAGMVGGRHISGDRSLVKANASLDSMVPRIVQQSAEEFVERVFAENSGDDDDLPGPGSITFVTEQPSYPTQLPVVVSEADTSSEITPAEVEEATKAAPEGTTDESAEGEEEAEKKIVLSNATHFSRTDPDATLIAREQMPPMLAYSAEIWTDSKAGVITHADGVKGTVREYATAMQSLRRQREEFGLPIAVVSADKGYGIGSFYRQLKESGIVGFIPRHDKKKSGLYGLEDFRYNEGTGNYLCPGGHELKYSHLQVRWPWARHVWYAKTKDCQSCELRAKCTKSSRYRSLEIGIYQADYEEMDKRLAGPGARLAKIARSTGPEPRFGQAKQWQGMTRAKYRGLEKFQGQVLLIASAQNLKKYVKWIWRKGQGTGLAKLPDTATTFFYFIQPSLLLTRQPIHLLRYD
jgi:transposase